MNNFPNYTLTLKEEILKTFTHLHNYPELSWKETATTEYLQNKLKSLDLKTTTFNDCTGVIGEWIGNQSGLTVALRADMDALWQNVSGKWCAIHSCGHDAHMTIVLAAIELLKISGFVPPGKIKIIFQPAEEKGTGALKLIEKGVIDDIDYLYGLHLRPIQEIPLYQAAAAIYNGAALNIDGEIKGIAAHGSRPHLGVNVIEVAAYLVQALKSIYTNPMIPATVKMTKLRAGGDSTNIIPDYADFALDLRAQTNQVLEELHKKIEFISNDIAHQFNASIKLIPGQKIVAAEVNEEAKSLLAQAISLTLGKENLTEDIITPGGEDFHYYTVKKPNLKATMLGLGCNLEPGLHHPEMTFNKEALLIGAEILAQVIVETFAK